MSTEIRPEEKAPLVSVIMPCFNAERFVQQAVESVFAQTYGNVELIVVDDGSEDQSVAVINGLKGRYGERLKVLQTRHAGPYPARNLGLNAASGQWVAFLDADDYWAPHCIASLFHAAEREEADLAYCGWQNVGDVPAGGDPYIPPQYELGDAAYAFLRSCPWPIHAALVRKKVIDAIHGFSTRRFASMDYDLWLRAYACSQRITRVPEVLAFYRWHGAGQISAIKWRQVIDAWNVRRDFVANSPHLVAHLTSETIRDLTNGALLRAGYAALWKRDLTSAQKIFRQAFKAHAWERKDLTHVLPSLLPMPFFRTVVQLFSK